MRVARVDGMGDLPRVLRELGLTEPLPTLVVVGGADSLTSTDRERLEPAIQELVDVVERANAAIVDGGTESGVMRMVGRAARGRTFPLVGVVVEAMAGEPWARPAEGQAPLDPDHTHVLLVPGEQWGDEVPWLARVAGLVAGGAPSATVLVNGGEIAYADVAASIAEGRPVLVAAGSGGTADDLAAAIRGEASGELARSLAASGLVRAVDLRDDAGPPLVEEIGRILSTGS